jgi:cardiolipin synthase
MPSLFSPPNLLTCVRIALTPFIVFAVIENRCERALWLCLIAGSTDAADGYLARKWGQVSRVGAYLDPIADKFLLTSLYLCFGIARLAPWWVVWLVIGRDVMILSLAAGGLFWKGIRDFPPTISGKVCTLLQIATSLAIIAQCSHGISTEIANAFVYTTAIATAWSGVQYLRRAIRSWAAVSR